MMKGMMHVTTQRDLTEILRDFDPDHTVAKAIIFLGNVSGFWGSYDYNPKNLSTEFQTFVDSKYDELEAYIDADITDAPIEDDEIRDILHAWVYAQRVLIHKGIDRIAKAAADRY